MIPEYRTYDVNEKKMHDVICIDFQRRLFWIDFNLSPYSFGNAPLLQWTGYLDKHNKKIYEGDIIYHCYFKAYYQIIWGKFSDCCVQGETWVMSPDVWQCALGYWCQQSEQENVEYNYDEDGGIEVVGDIYENPELLDIS